jgi:NTE family protein
MPKSRSRAKPKTVNLALQGGGAHGAFTWGVLDTLLAEPRLEIEAVSGTSAGAMNAVIMASGYLRDGREGARAALGEFWRAVADASRFTSVRGAPGLLLLDMVSRIVSPYDVNPLDINPLRDVLNERVDWQKLRDDPPFKLFIAATNVESGKVRVFRENELISDMLLASACLPTLFKAVEIDGIPYWDGGYSANPALFPFAGETESRDVILVHINPINRPGTPKNARDILNRLNEITFNASLMKELRAIDFVARLIDGGALSPEAYRKLHLHRIGSDALANLPAASKMNTEWAYMERLFALGQAAATDFLDENWREIGKRSTLDIMALVN